MTSRHLELAEAAWRWVLDQVRHDDSGVWIPLTPESTEPFWDRDGIHSGIGGLALTLDCARRVRPWTDEESDLADAIGERLRAVTAESTNASWFDGLSGFVETLSLLEQPGIDLCVERLLGMAPADREHYNDVTLGTAGVLRAGVVAVEAGCERGAELAAYASELLLAEAEETPAGLNWLFVPRRFVPEEKLQGGRPVEMPNYSHGLAGVVRALADAGLALGREDLTEAARLGAEHLVTLAPAAVLDAGGFALPREIPHWKPGNDEFAWNWCHGPAGLLATFAALAECGVNTVAGESIRQWVDRCLHSLETSGIPERRYPGFWDNDGQCCGTAGVGSAVLPFGSAMVPALADVLADRAYVEGDRAYWRFIEHRNEEPLLPPGVGWTQGVAGIAGFLFERSAWMTLRLGRLHQGPSVTGFHLSGNR